MIKMWTGKINIKRETQQKTSLKWKSLCYRFPPLAGPLPEIRVPLPGRAWLQYGDSILKVPLSYSNARAGTIPSPTRMEHCSNYLSWCDREWAVLYFKAASLWNVLPSSSILSCLGIYMCVLLFLLFSSRGTERSTRDSVVLLILIWRTRDSVWPEEEITH